jgi:hypothetical protein
MPRRNRNAKATTIPPDVLADQLACLARDLARSALCAGCRANRATEGDYCALCKGLIITFARRSTLTRR